MLSKKLEITLHNALNLATEKSHEYATLEHLLVALIGDDDARAVMRGCGVDSTILREDVLQYLDEELDDLKVDKPSESKPTTGFQRVLQRAAIHVQSSGREEVTGANVLIALFSERESHAVYFLGKQEMTRFDAVNYVSHGIAKVEGEGEFFSASSEDSDADEEEDGKSNVSGNDAMKTYCVNLNQRAKDGKIDVLIGR